MNYFFNWIKKNPGKVIILIICAFLIPIVIVHALFKWDAGVHWLAAEWSAGDVLGYIAAFEAFLGASALSILALWQGHQNRIQQIERDEPMLSMKLVPISGMLYLVVENTSSTEARNINITVQSISNNGRENKLMLDGLFHTEFELFPKESVHGRIAFSGADMASEIFPQVQIHVSYLRPDINRLKEYDRTVTYNCGYDAAVTADINYDNSRLESDIDKIARASVRIANYLDGCQVAKFDELNILAGKSLRNDLAEAVSTGKKAPVLSRIETIRNSLFKTNSKNTPD